MIFGMWVGSKGTSERSFTIRIPINISPWSRITVTPGESPLEIEGHPAAIFEEHGFYVLEVYGFPCEEAAYEILPSIQAGVIWAALRHSIALPFTRQTAAVTYDELPISGETEITRQFLEKGWDRLDGDYPWNLTVIKPEHKRLAVEAVPGARVIPNIPDQDIVVKLSEAMQLPHPEKVFDDEKLRHALNTYSSSFFQFDDNARFITLVIVLETLNPNRPVPQYVKDTINELLVQVKEVRDAYEKDELDSRYEDYDSLLNRLTWLEIESIRQGIRSLVAETLQSDPDVSDPEAVGREARDIYDLRSALVHPKRNHPVSEGDIQAAIQRLMDIVPRVLLVMIAQVTRDS